MRHQSLVKIMMILSFIFGLSTQVFADDISEIEAMKQFLFNGTDIATVKLKESKEETRYREEMQDSTCTRQVPYEAEECGNVTYYRQECHTVPGRNNCYDVSDRVCNDVTRYRQVCHRGPSRRVCRDVPGRRICKPGPSVQRCSKQPNRRVCEGGTCRIIEGRRTCRQVAGPDVCHTGPSRRECDDILGDRICRDEPYRDTVCHNETRQQCDWIPAHEECQQVPYQEWECHMVTRYRSEDYPCQVPVQVPYQVTVVTDASVDFNFENFGDEVESLFTIKLENGKTSLKVTDRSTTPYYIFDRHEDQVVGSGDLERTVESVHNVFFISKAKALSPLNSEIELKSLKETSLSFSMGEIFFDQSVRVSLVIKKKDKTILSTLVDLSKAQIQTQEGKSTVTINLKDYNVELKRGWGRKYDLNFKVLVEPQLINRGQLLMDLSRENLTKEASFKKQKPAKD